MKKIMPIHTESQLLTQLMTDYSRLTSTAEKQQWLSNLQAPLIEAIDDHPDHCLVTFLCQNTADKNTSIFLYSPVTGFPCSPGSRLILYPGTDMTYLTLLLPANLRMSYSFLIVSREYHYKDQDITSQPIQYPQPAGELAHSLWLFNQLMENNAVCLDPYNPGTIVYYKDWENPVEFFAKESILELPKALASLIPIKNNLAVLTQKKRLISASLDFNDTSLSGNPDYHNAQRKYWVYLPPGYDAAKTYPLILFLDGSDYLGLFLAPSILDTFIQNGDIPPCLAVFFDYSPDKRMVEYNCNVVFTDFIAEELLLILSRRHQLSIAASPEMTTIVGYSASGLAAIYAGIARADRFGRVIAQSPSLEILKKYERHDVMTRNLSRHTRFYLESGSLETLPAELIFADGSSQALNSLQACREMVEELQQQGWFVYFNEFMGGHNTVCWRQSLPARIKTIFSALR